MSDNPYIPPLRPKGRPYTSSDAGETRAIARVIPPPLPAALQQQLIAAGLDPSRMQQFTASLLNSSRTGNLEGFLSQRLTRWNLRRTAKLLGDLTAYFRVASSLIENVGDYQAAPIRAANKVKQAHLEGDRIDAERAEARQRKRRADSEDND